jgi:hypothetical protein
MRISIQGSRRGTDGHPPCLNYHDSVSDTFSTECNPMALQVYLSRPNVDLEDCNV